MFHIFWLSITYRGKTNHYVREKRCEQCDQYGQHISCDARAWITIDHIPLIPMRKHRLINECSSCKNFQTMILEEWKGMIERVRNEAIQLYKTSSANPKTARNVIRTAIDHPIPELLVELGRSIETALRYDFETLLLLYRAYESLGMKDDSKRLFPQVDKLEMARSQREKLSSDQS